MNESPKTLKPRNSLHKSIIYNSFLLFLKSRAAFHRWRKNKSKLWKKAAKSVVVVLSTSNLTVKKCWYKSCFMCLTPWRGPFTLHSLRETAYKARRTYKKSPLLFNIFIPMIFQNRKDGFFQGVLFFIFLMMNFWRTISIGLNLNFWEHSAQMSLHEIENDNILRNTCKNWNTGIILIISTIPMFHWNNHNMKILVSSNLLWP